MVRAIKRSEVEGKRNSRTGIRVKNSKAKKREFNLNYRQLFLIALMLLIFMGSGIGYVWSNFEGTQIGYDLSLLQKEELKLKEFNQKLRTELATLRSPQNLEEAIHRIGLRQPFQEQIVILP